MDPDIRSFLEELAAYDGFAPLSEAKAASLSHPDRVVTVSDGESLVAVGASATHKQLDGSTHVSVETAIAPSLRFPEFEGRILDAALDLVPTGVAHSVWSRRSSLDAALDERKFGAIRSLAEMAIDLPIAGQERGSGGLSLRTFAEGDEETLIRINGAAFADHREAGSLDQAELAELMDASWFDPAGILFHDVEGTVAAFCWTKVHGNGEGEIYRIGVDAPFRGLGIGAAIVEAGFTALAGRGCVTGMLWVDEANRAAMALYEGIGMTVRARNKEFARPT